MPRTVCAAVLLALAVAGCGSQTASDRRVSFATIDTDPDWSPDGRLIAFASSRGGGGIYIIRSDGTGLRRIFRGNASNLDWSPDGRSLAFDGAGGISVLYRGVRRAVRVLSGRRFSRPSWAPDGRRLAVVMELGDLSTGIYVVNADGTGLRRLVAPHLAKSNPHWDFVDASETEPSWSPDGREIAFQAGDGRLVAVKLADGRVRQIVKTRAFEPAWSPDGKLIAFQSEDGLWVADADGSGTLRHVASEGIAAAGGDPSWSPDSRRLVFEVSHDRGRYWRRAKSLSVVDATGDHLGKLTFGGSSLDDPTWRNDAPMIF
jgi:Tol biopolymer transport system component